TGREAAARSQRPAIKAPIPYGVALNSAAKVTAGCSFLYSANSRGANSSPNALEPLSTSVSVVLLDGQPATSALSANRPTFLKAVFMAHPPGFMRTKLRRTLSFVLAKISREKIDCRCVGWIRLVSLARLESDDDRIAGDN